VLVDRAHLVRRPDASLVRSGRSERPVLFRGAGQLEDPGARIGHALQLLDRATALLMGVDEFVNEQTLRRSAGYLAVRFLHGYGTVSSERWFDLGDWLTRHRAEVSSHLADDDPHGRITLDLELHPREPATDGDTDPVELRLRLTPPDSGGDLPGGALADTIERLITLAGTEDDGDIDIDAVRPELISWVTEADLAPGHPAAGLLLARIRAGIDASGDDHLAPVDPSVDEHGRPVLVTTRFLQEWQTRWMARPNPGRPVEHRSLRYLEADDHPQYLPADGSRPLRGDLNAGGNAVRGLAASTGPSHAVRRDEVVGGDLAAGGGGLRIERLQGKQVSASGEYAPREGEVLRYDGNRWVPSGVPDPAAPPEATADVRSVLPLASVELLGRTADDAASFLVWFHAAGLDATATLAPLSGGQPLVYAENLSIRTQTCTAGRLRLTRIPVNRVAVQQVACNRFRVDVARQEAEYLRFEFDLTRIQLANGQDLAQWTQTHDAAWVGQAPSGVVTVFVVNPSLQRPLEGFEQVDTVVLPGGGSRVVADRR
jgi:hypothetical protein